MVSQPAAATANAQTNTSPCNTSPKSPKVPFSPVLQPLSPGKKVFGARNLRFELAASDNEPAGMEVVCGSFAVSNCAQKGNDAMFLDRLASLEEENDQPPLVRTDGVSPLFAASFVGFKKSDFEPPFAQMSGVSLIADDMAPLSLGASAADCLPKADSSRAGKSRSNGRVFGDDEDVFMADS